MPAINFKPQFAFDVEAGNKRRTIRQPRKRGEIYKGAPLFLYTGLRTKKAERLLTTHCVSVRDVMIDHMGVEIEGRRLYAGDTPAYQGGEDPEYYDGDFARADGFDNFTDMVEFFRRQYGLPFVGKLIEW